MHPHDIWCPNVAGPASGQVGQGTSGVHSQQDRRSRCRVCGKTCGARTGTILHRRRTDEACMIQVLTLVRWGCPVSASAPADGSHAHTVRAWLEAAGRHAAAVQHDHVVQPRDLGQGPADDVRGTTQCGVVWMALAMLGSSRRWVGGVMSTRRDQRLMTRVVAVLAAGAVIAPRLLVVDGVTSYVAALRRAFRTRDQRGGRGAPRNGPWPDLRSGQVVKQTCRRRVGGVSRRVVQGTRQTVDRLVTQTPGCRVRTTASSERLHGTLRARVAPLARRTQQLVQRKDMLHAGM